MTSADFVTVGLCLMGLLCGFGLVWLAVNAQQRKAG